MYITPEDKVRTNLLTRLEVMLLESKENARVELNRLCDDKDSMLITYNHYYTDNVQNARQATTRALIKTALEEVSTADFNSKMHISNTSVDAEKLLGALQRRVLVDMEDQACSEAQQGLLAYYKVSSGRDMQGRLLTDSRWPARHSSTTCAYKSSNDTSFGECPRSCHRSEWRGTPMRNFSPLPVRMNTSWREDVNYKPFRAVSLQAWKIFASRFTTHHLIFLDRCRCSISCCPRLYFGRRHNEQLLRGGESTEQDSCFDHGGRRVTQSRKTRFRRANYSVDGRGKADRRMEHGSLREGAFYPVRAQTIISLCHHSLGTGGALN